MAAMSQNCRMMEEHQYWKEFQTNRHTFFKIMIGDFRNQLRIPKKFTINFRENLSGTISLRGPSGLLWPVELKRTIDQTVLRKGWDKFVKDNVIQITDFLVFQYDGNSTFNVVIFDASGCERVGSHFVNKHTSVCSNGRCVFQKEHGENSNDVIDMDEIHENHNKKEKLKKGRRNLRSKAVEETTKKKKMQAENSDAARNGLMNEAEEVSRCAMETRQDCSDDCESLKKNSKRDQDDSGKKGRPPHLQKTYNKLFISNRREITEEEKCRASKLAKQYSSTRPSFTVVMKPTHVYMGFTLMIPVGWLEKHISATIRRAELKVPPLEKRWHVVININHGRGFFGRGWSKFVKDNNLEEHDVCVFEVNEEGKAHYNCMEFNVIIFRVLDEIVPLTQWTRSLRASANSESNN